MWSINPATYIHRLFVNVKDVILFISLTIDPLLYGWDLQKGNNIAGLANHLGHLQQALESNVLRISRRKTDYSMFFRGWGKGEEKSSSVASQ